MYYQFDSRLSMPAILFDDDRIVVGGKEYEYTELTDIEITKTPMLATYGILELRTIEKTVPVPFARADMHRLRMAIQEVKHIIKTYGAGADRSDTALESEAVPNRADTEARQGFQAPSEVSKAAPEGRALLDPYEEMKKLKELLDLDIITEEEFARKKKELLRL